MSEYLTGKNAFLAFGLFGRLVLVYIASIIDERTPNMKYTDTDYDVFSDAATHVWNGNSPYARHTYRYTPLAAYIVLVNNFIHPLAGKIIFCLLDLAMGIFMWSLIESQNKNKKWTMLYVAFWLYNPVTVGMSTRGSNDNIIALLVFATLYFLLNRQYFIGGFVYGLSIHFKMYPIIYCIPFYFFIDCDRKAILSGKSLFSIIFNCNNFVTKNRLVFGFTTVFTLAAFTGLFYWIYGYQFLYESLLYHFERKDNRHNYSVYWYMIYQTYDIKSSIVMAFLMFIP